MVERARIWDIVTLISAWAFFLSLCLVITTPYNSIAHMTGMHLMLASVIVRFIWSFIARDAASISGFIPWPQQVFSNLYLTFTLDTTPYEGHSPIGGILAFITLLYGGITAFNGITDSYAYGSMLEVTSYLWLTYALGTVYQMVMQQIEPFGFIFKGQGSVYVPSISDEEKNNTSLFALLFDKLALPALVIGVFAFVSIVPTLTEYNINAEDALSVAFDEKEAPSARDLANIETAAGRQTNSLEETLQFTTLDEINRRSNGTQPQVGRVDIRQQRALMQQQAAEQARSTNPIDTFELPIQTEE